MVYSFTLSGSESLSLLILLALVITGVGLVLLAFFGRKKNENTKGIKQIFHITIGLGLSIIMIGVILFFVLGQNYTVKIGSGYISVNGPIMIGNENITSSDISSAYIGNIISGNITLSLRTGGTSIGNLNAGKFLLSNNANAYLASENSTDIIIKLKNGNYLILGNNNTSALAAIVSKYVYNVSKSGP
jgi:hypothetical protein